MPFSISAPNKLGGTQAAATAKSAKGAVAAASSASAAAMAAAKKSRSYAAPVNKLLPLWDKTPETYTVFKGSSPDLDAPSGRGTGHCLFTSKQWLTALDLAVGAAENGKFVNDATASVAAMRSKLSVDRKFRVPVMRGLQG
jgi:hypothetical protein